MNDTATDHRGASAREDQSSIAAPAIRSSIWTMAGYAASQLLRLGCNLVLARLLFPAVFGELALVSIFISGLQFFSDIGTGPAIVQSDRGDDPIFLNTAWVIQCVRGFALWLASCVIAWPAAAFYREPMLGWLIPAAGLEAIFSGFESTSVHGLQRHLRLGRLTIFQLTAQTAGTIVTVALALADRWLYGPNDPNAAWAMVAGALIGSVTRLVLSHTFLPGIRNRFQFDIDAATQLFHFGRWIFVSTLLTFFAMQSDRLIFGKMIPFTLLGVYSIASTLGALPVEAASRLGSFVIFPAYSRLVARDDFVRLYWRVRIPVLIAGAACVSGLFAGGPFLIRLLFDERYVAAGAILQYLSAAAWFRTLESTTVAALLAKGRVRWMAAGNGVKVLAMLVMIPLGFHLGGFRGALLGLVASDFLKYVTSAFGAAASGLPGYGRDSLFTLAVAFASLAGFSGGALARSTGDLAALGASAGVAVAPWTILALDYLRRQKRGALLARTAAIRA